ncbi:MAG: DNA-3-methyladenine glycosylase [Opitutales bacterium]
MGRVLKQGFFRRGTPEVARELLGKQLCRRLESGSILRARITETEAYDGFEDRASHAHRGPTPRNAIMFGPPAYAYVYLCYGVHWLFNITTREKGYPAAVLLRGVAGVRGPGRLTRHFRIDKSFDQRLLTRTGGLWVEDDGFVPDESALTTAPRVGVPYAGPEWAQKQWRFVWQPPQGSD